MGKSRKTYKRRIVGLSVLLAFLLALATFLIFWFFGARYPEFYADLREEAAIPGLKEGIAPQGLCPVESEEYEFAMSGYMVDGSASRVYLIGEDKSKFVTLKEGGEDVKTHFGGITAHGGYLIVASGTELLRVELSAALGAEDGAAVTVYDKFSTGIQNAFCYCDGEKLYAGEFYRAGNYETPKDHRITVDGETNYAFVYEYAADASKEGGVVSRIPEKVISVRAQVQGIAVCDGGIVLSTSYGLPDSRIFTYENILDGAPSGTATVSGKEVPLYRLDRTNLKSTLTAPCMSEELFVKDGRVYILFESLCKKYKYFVRTQIDRIVSLPLKAL